MNLVPLLPLWEKGLGVALSLPKGDEGVQSISRPINSVSYLIPDS